MLILLFSDSVMYDFLWSNGLQHTRLPCSSSSPGVDSDSCPLSHDAIQPFHLLSPPSPPALNLPQHHDLFQWVGSSHQVAKVLELQLQHQSFQLIFRVKKQLRKGMNPPKEEWVNQWSKEKGVWESVLGNAHLRTFNVRAFTLSSMDGLLVRIW